ncbi:hypothetical protein TNCV_4557121 [Trichonephila clavipes]|nr:hypothetical protein TNCV_4557121 [Trichonephila clavipes]
MEFYPIPKGQWMGDVEMTSLQGHSPDKRQMSKLLGSYGGYGSLVVKVMGSLLACHEFEPSTTENPPYRGAMHVKSIESSNVLPLVWCKSWERGASSAAQVSSSSLDHGSKLRGPSPKAFDYS